MTRRSPTTRAGSLPRRAGRSTCSGPRVRRPISTTVNRRWGWRWTWLSRTSAAASAPRWWPPPLRNRQIADGGLPVARRAFGLIPPQQLAGERRLDRAVLEERRVLRLRQRVSHPLAHAIGQEPCG